MKIVISMTGSEVAGESAAGLAAASMVFRVKVMFKNILHVMISIRTEFSQYV